MRQRNLDLLSILSIPRFPSQPLGVMCLFLLRRNISPARDLWWQDIPSDIPLSLGDEGSCQVCRDNEVSGKLVVERAFVGDAGTLGIFWQGWGVSGTEEKRLLLPATYCQWDS